MCATNPTRIRVKLPVNLKHLMQSSLLTLWNIVTEPEQILLLLHPATFAVFVSFPTPCSPLRMRHWTTFFAVHSWSHSDSNIYNHDRFTCNPVQHKTRHISTKKPLKSRKTYLTSRKVGACFDLVGRDVTAFLVKSAVDAVRLQHKSAVEEVSGDRKQHRRFAVQSNTPQLFPGFWLSGFADFLLSACLGFQLLWVSRLPGFWVSRFLDCPLPPPPIPCVQKSGWPSSMIIVPHILLFSDKRGRATRSGVRWTHSSWILRGRNEEVLFSVWNGQEAETVPE